MQASELRLASSQIRRSSGSGDITLGKEEAMPHINNHGVSVHYSDTGTGEPVVLLHGVGSSGAQWKRVGVFLPDRFRLIAVNHYGHGKTDSWPSPPESLTHDDEAKLVQAVIEEVGPLVHLVGHSYGGGVALRMVLNGGDKVKSLTLVEPTAMSVLKHAGEISLFEEFRAMATGFLARVADSREEEAWLKVVDDNGAPGTWDSLPDEAKAGLLAMTKTGIGTSYGNLSHQTTLGECKNIEIPALVLCGERTPAFHRRMAEIVAEHLPESRMTIIPGAGHLSPITHPEPVAKAIASHLSG